MGCTAPVDKNHLKAPPLKGKHKITQHLAFVAVFCITFFPFHQLHDTTSKDVVVCKYQ